jgi:pimeloyl-ACP methyl ester carboxylesterase
MNEDALTAYGYLTKDVDVEPERIILGGRSLGSAVAIELATRVPSGGLLLLSAIDSVPATASRFYFWAPVSLLASQRFDSMAKAPRVAADRIREVRNQLISRLRQLEPLRSAARLPTPDLDAFDIGARLPGKHDAVTTGLIASLESIKNLAPTPPRGDERASTPGGPKH